MTSDFETQFASRLPFEKAAAIAAGAGDVANLAYSRPFDPGPLSDPATLQKMRLLFGPMATDDLTKSFGAEASMANFEQPPPSGLAGLGQRLRAAGQAPLNMAGRNFLGGLLYQDPAATALTMRSNPSAPNAFDATRLRLPPTLSFGTASLVGALQASGAAPNSSQP